MPTSIPLQASSTRLSMASDPGNQYFYFVIYIPQHHAITIIDTTSPTELIEKYVTTCLANSLAVQGSEFTLHSLSSNVSCTVHPCSPSNIMWHLGSSRMEKGIQQFLFQVDKWCVKATCIH